MTAWPRTSPTQSFRFADDTTVVALITNNDETAYREEMRGLAEWCDGTNLSLNKTKELIVDYRRP